MMQFRTTKANLVTILEAGAVAGGYRVVDHQVQVLASDEILGTKRRVQVFYGEGDFPEGEAGFTGPVQHDAVYRIELACSAASEVNLNVLNNVDSTDEQRAAAIAAFKSSSKLADDSMDELFDKVWNVLMSGVNVDMGETKPYKATSRWVGSFRKESPVPQGEYVELTGNIGFSCKLEEQPEGVTGTAAVQPAFDITDDIDGDDNEKTGVITGADPA